MSAKASLDQKGTTTGIPLASSPHETQNIQRFFVRVYIYLKEGQLPKALDLIEKEGEAYHKNLGGSNKQPIIACIGKEGLTPDQRAGKLVALLKKSQALFPEVNPDDFEAARLKQNDTRFKYMLGSLISAATTSSPHKVVSDAEAVKMVKALGMQAGLSESDVENSLEEIVLNDGSRTWMIKTEHNDQNKAWENALIKLAASKELIFFCESHIRSDREERLVCVVKKLGQKGYFRGLETEISAQQISIICGLIALMDVKTGKKPSDKFFNTLHQIIFNIVIHSQAKKDLAIAANQSKTAALVQKTLRSVNNNTDTNELFAISKEMFAKANLDGWEEFLITLASITFKTHSSPESEITLQVWLHTYKKVGREMIDTEKFYSLKDKFLAEWRKVRDPSYARIFRKERETMPKGIPTFVLFGGNHAPGFKRALLGLGTDKSDSGDRADSKKSKNQSLEGFGIDKRDSGDKADSKKSKNTDQ